MQTRRLGRTGHRGSLVTFGAAALWNVSQAEVEAAIELAMEQGVNHFDVAPTYGKAERLLRPWMKKNHEIFFRPYVKKVIYRYLDCGDPHNGFARVKCNNCGHEYQGVGSFK